MIQQPDRFLIILNNSKEQPKLQAIQQKLSQFPKFFFCMQSNTLLIYDHSSIYVISKEQAKMTDLGKTYTIQQITYNHIKNILIFLTAEGELYAHFLSFKTQIQMKKSIKKQILFDWIYNVDSLDLFIADHGAVKLYKVDEEKKSIKEIKSISGKYNSFLYSPLSQVLGIFPVGDCRYMHSLVFDEDKSKGWFKGPQIKLDIESDEILQSSVKKNKSLGLKNSSLNKECFSKLGNEDHYAQLLKMNNKTYLVFYFSNEGKLKLYPIEEDCEREITIKLPSDSTPVFHVVDNMLIIHLRNQRITFIYDVSTDSAQMLVSPFPIEHSTRKSINPYTGSFYGKRHIMPDGVISKWAVNVEVIHNYLKNETQIFDFLLKRKKARSQLLRWLRQKLLTIKQINLSKFWKFIFIKSLSGTHKERDVISLIDLYASVFYTLSIDELTPKEPLLNTTVQCIRQANEMMIKIPFELQKLVLELLLQCNKYELLVFLCHNDIIKDNESLAELLFSKSIKINEPILNTLAIDMANRVCKDQKVFEFLVLSQKIWEARRYLKQHYENIEILFMIYVSDGIRDQSLREQYLSFVRSFILKKFPSTNEKYLDQAQHNIKQSRLQRKSMSSSQLKTKSPTKTNPSSLI